jgi:hypothetical protein
VYVQVCLSVIKPTTPTKVLAASKSATQSTRPDAQATCRGVRFRPHSVTKTADALGGPPEDGDEGRDANPATAVRVEAHCADVVVLEHAGADGKELADVCAWASQERVTSTSAEKGGARRTRRHSVRASAEADSHCSTR